MLPFASAVPAGEAHPLSFLTILAVMAFVTVLMVGIGDRTKLPYPVLMLLAATGIAFIPGIPSMHIPGELILPLFLPPLLYAAASKTSWSVFRIRWRSILLMAVALVVMTVAVAAGIAWLMIPAIGIPAAIALGAIISPPDPVAVESVAGRVHMPRRLISVLQGEGLFNDAAAIVIFQAAVAATVSRQDIDGSVITKFLLGAVIAVVLGLAMGMLTKFIQKITESYVASSAITLVAPFAVYIIAESFHASGVIAVIVTALEVRRNSRPSEAAERITSQSFWQVLELIVTGIAFALIGMEMRRVFENGHLPELIVPALAVSGAIIVLRFIWLAVLMVVNRRINDGLPPFYFKDVIILGWSGMRGLPTLALALALPVTLADGTPFHAREQIFVIACTVLVMTLIIPGLTLPWLMKVLNVKEEPGQEKLEAEVLAQRAQEAATAALNSHPAMKELTEEEFKAVKKNVSHLSGFILDEDDEPDFPSHHADFHEAVAVGHAIVLAAAREEIMRARGEIATDPEVADKVLRKMDHRTVIIED